MMEKYYDTGYDYAGYDIYVGQGTSDPLYLDLPFFAQAQFIRDLHEGRINLSARGTVIHGGTALMSGMGMHYLASKGFLDARLFRMGATHGMRHAARVALFHGMTQSLPLLVPAAIAVAGAVTYEQGVMNRCVKHLVVLVAHGMGHLPVGLEQWFDIGVYTPCIHGETILESQNRW